MPKSKKVEETTPEIEAELTEKETEKASEEKPKTVPPKPPISRSGPAFPPAHQFHGTRGNMINNRQRPGRAANRGR